MFFLCRAMFLFPQSFFDQIFFTQRRCRFRLARESSQQLKKALAETEAAHFVSSWAAVFFVSRMGCEQWKTGTSKCKVGKYTQTHGELLKMKNQFGEVDCFRSCSRQNTDVDPVAHGKDSLRNPIGKIHENRTCWGVPSNLCGKD